MCKSEFVLKENMKSFISKYGEDKCGFLTLTFSDSVFCVKEASRRFNSFRTNFLKRFARAYIGVYERHKSGVIHFHMVVALDSDIRSGFNMDLVRKRQYRNGANKYLRGVWATLRTVLPLYGFGRHQLIPIWSSKGVADYLAKYLVKGMKERSVEDKGFRLVRMSQDKVNFWKVATSRFAWFGERSIAWRKALADWVEHNKFMFQNDFYKKTGFIVDVNNETYSFVLNKIAGAKWCYVNSNNILRFSSNV